MGYYMVEENVKPNLRGYLKARRDRNLIFEFEKKNRFFLSAICTPFCFERIH